jgi:hypothetical protein
LPSSRANLRRRRIAQAAAQAQKDETTALKAFKEAEKHIGYREEPKHGVNDNMFGRWYGWNWVAWCAIFESYCFAHTGWKKFHYAAVEQIYHDAMANRNGLFIVRSPRRGDIVGYRIGGSEFAHTAFFDEWVSSNALRDLGGNTGPQSISNGGMVMRQVRYTNIVRYYARVTR